MITDGAAAPSGQGTPTKEWQRYFEEAATKA